MAPAAQAQLGTLTGSAKLDAVTKLMDKLSQDLQKINLLPHQRDAALEELKIYGRDPRNADPIFTKEGIETLTRHAFNSPSKTTARNALRCLANALLIKPETRQIFVDLGYESKACTTLKQDNLDDEFLVSRILFLTTYGTDIKLLTLIDQYHLGDIIVQNLSRHAARAKSPAGKGKARQDPMEGMALAETLKLLFNVTHFCAERTSSFTPAVTHILTILTKHDLSTTQPLDPPFGPLVNALLNLELQNKDVQSALFPKAEQNAVVDRLVLLLDLSTKQYKDNDLEQVVTPLVGVIGKVYESAPEDVRGHIRAQLLPTEEDRQKILGRTDSLPSRLLRNSTNPVTPELREAISHLLFDMSDKDASKFVENVGYGFASGFLFQNNLPIPENASEAYSTSSADTERRLVNPVTGQFIDKEKFADVPELTEEEKEREAERLFVLFERLKKTGIIDVQNPVEKAFQEGRFEELDSDDDAVEEVD